MVARNLLIPFRRDRKRDLATGEGEAFLASNLLVEMFAFVGDVLTFYQDNLARESRLVTATQRKNVMALAKMVGYRLSGAQPATRTRVSTRTPRAGTGHHLGGDHHSHAGGDRPVRFQLAQSGEKGFLANKKRYTPAMGFDFQMVEIPQKLPPAQVKQFKNYVAQYEQRLGAFSFFASAMPAVVSVLVVSGVASDEPHAPFPAWPPGGMDEEAAQALGGQLMRGETPKGAKPAQVAAMKAYLEERQLVVAARSKKKSQVPLFKLQSNEGWVVTPEECKLIAAAFSAHLDAIAKKRADPAYEREWKKEGARMPERFRPQSFEQDGPMTTKFRDKIQSFVEFNLLAAMHGGYTVL